MSLFSGIHRGIRNYAAVQSASDATKRVITAETTVSELSRRVEALALANQALFEIVKARFDRSEEDIITRMAQIDARDEGTDGKMTARVVSCRACGKRISTARLKCRFCDEVVTDGHVFQKG